MMRIFIAILLLYVPGCVVAQSLSIEALWESLGDSYRQQRQAKEVLLRKVALDEERQGLFPVIYGDANVQRNLIVPVTPVPAIAFNPSAEEGAIVPLKFSTKWSSKAGVQMEWKIFDPKRRSSRDEMELELEKAELEKESDAQEWRREATLAYASVVLATHQYEQAQQDSSIYAAVLDLVKVRHEAGRESGSSYYDALQEMERKRIKLYQSWAVLWDANNELQKYIDLKATLHLSTDIQGICDFVRNKRKESYTIKTLQVDRQIALMRLQGLRKEQLPVLTLNGYIGGQYYGNEFRIDRKEDWFGNSFVNLALRVPISAYLSNKPSLRKAQLNTLIYEEQIVEEERLQVIADKQREVKIVAIEKELLGLRKITALAKEHMASQEQAYREGRLLLSELNLSFLNYNKALLDVWQAEFDRIALILE